MSDLLIDSFFRTHRLLSSVTWQEDKKEQAVNDRLEKRVRAQDVLKEIERAHFANATNTREESSEKFNEWLVSQGFPRRDDKKNSIFINNSKKLAKSTSTNAISEKSKSKEQQEKTLKSRKKKESPSTTDIDWNFSTKSADSEYTTNLNDFYPRDPFTQLPENVDLLMLNRELRGEAFQYSI